MPERPMRPRLAKINTLESSKTCAWCRDWMWRNKIDLWRSGAKEKAYVSVFLYGVPLLTLLCAFPWNTSCLLPLTYDLPRTVHGIKSTATLRNQNNDHVGANLAVFRFCPKLVPKLALTLVPNWPKLAPNLVPNLAPTWPGAPVILTTQTKNLRFSAYG